MIWIVKYVSALMNILQKKSSREGGGDCLPQPRYSYGPAGIHSGNGITL